MAIRFKRQTSSYNPKEHKFKEGVKDVVYALESAGNKAKDSTISLTNTLVALAKHDYRNAIAIIQNPGRIAGLVESRFKGHSTHEQVFQDWQKRFSDGQIDDKEYQRALSIYETYKTEKDKNAVVKSRLLQNDAEYQAYMENRNISFFSPKRVALAVTREVASDLMNPYQLAIDYFGGKIGSLAVKGLSKYGKWARIGGELSVSAATAGTANVVESYSYGKRSPSELGKDFALGATFGFMLSGGTKGMKALKTKALAKASGAIDNAADNALAARYDVTKMTPDEAADLVTKQVDDVTKFVTETATGKKFNEPNVQRFDDLRVQNELGNQVTYGALTDNILDGRLPNDNDIYKVVQFDYKPNQQYDLAKSIVNQNPEAVGRLNRWLNDVPDELKRISDLPDAEIAKIAPNLNGKDLRDIQSLKSQILSDFDNIDAQMMSAGIKDYDTFSFLNDEYNFVTSDRIVNVDQLGYLKTSKEVKRIDDVYNSNMFESDDIITLDRDGYNFNTLQRDMPEDIINKRRAEVQNATNKSIAEEQAIFKQENPTQLTAAEFEARGNRIENMTIEDKNMFQTFLQNCKIGG